MKHTLLLIIFAICISACKEQSKPIEYVSMKNAPFLYNDSITLYYGVGFNYDTSQLYLNDSLIQLRVLNTDYSIAVAGVIDLRLDKQDTLKFVCRNRAIEVTRLSRYAFIYLNDERLGVRYDSIRPVLY